MGVAMEGRRVRLERVRVKHADALYRIAQTPDWPLAGGNLEFDAFVEHLWSSSEVQFSLIRKDADQVIGFVRGLRWNRRDGTMDVVFGVAPEFWRQLWPYEGIVIFCDYLLRGLGVRKLYFEMRVSTLAKLGSGVRRWLTRKPCTRDDYRPPAGSGRMLRSGRSPSLIRWSNGCSHGVMGSGFKLLRRDDMATSRDSTAMSLSRLLADGAPHAMAHRSVRVVTVCPWSAWPNGGPPGSRRKPNAIASDC